MELFLELTWTIGLSLLLSFILVKILSLSPYGKGTDFGFDNQTFDVKTTKRATGFVEKGVISRDEPKSSDFEVTCSGNDVLVDRQSSEICKEIEVEFVSEDDDDWEGIERSELERVFGAAVSFVECGRKDSRGDLSSDVKMQLYGLHKVATVGPCHEPYPMPLKISARAKWNAWKRLGNMDRESAMEQYITLLTGSIPDWNEDSGLILEEAVAHEKEAN